MVWIQPENPTSLRDFFATFIDISNYASVPTAKWWVGASGKNSQVPLLGDLDKTNAVGILFWIFKSFMSD